MLFWHGIKLIIILEIFCSITSSQFSDFGSDCRAFYNNSCFIYIKEPYISWENSRQDCITRGGHLTSINSENENEMIISLLKNYPGNTLGSSAWIGLNYTSYSESSNWEDGNPITYTKVPIINVPEGCISISGYGTWSSSSCSSERQRVCRKPGSAFAIRENGDYESITNNITISTLPTTLACRTDTYPQTTQIIWEYKATGDNDWASITGTTPSSSGISELTVQVYGSYRCNVKSGGADQIYTTTVLEFIPTTQTTTSTIISTTSTQTVTTSVFTSTKVMTTNETTYPDLFLNSKRNQAIFGGIIALILVLLSLIVATSITTIFLVIFCKRRNRTVNFKRINEEENRIRYENASEMRTETKTTESTEIAPPPIKAEYLNVHEVMNQMLEDEFTPSDDYIAMAEVEHTAKELMNECPYQNIPTIEPVDKTQENISNTKFTQITEAEIRKQFKILNSEYSILRHHQTTNIANEPNNKAKNPMENVVPYDNNRVTLMTENTQNNYINASYISNMQFIITIHPMENTLPDFLQMLYQTEASFVVMLTTKKELSEIEWNISQRVAYWGQQGSVREYGQFVVKTSAVTKSEETIIQTIILHNANENRENTFKQITSICWEDKANNIDAKNIVKLVESILAHKNEQQGSPIVIHCSDGIGKSGVLATVLKVIEEVEEKGDVDVNDVVKQLRMERKYIVPSLTHYSSCYSILKEYYMNKLSD